MKQNLSLSIPKPCTEKWNAFTPALNGAFCGACNKTVLDFTKMSDAEVLNFFTAKPAHTCGRFRPDQLKHYAGQTPFKINPGLTLLKAGFLSLLFILVSKQTSAQSIPAKTEIVQYPVFKAEKNTTAKPDKIVRGLIKSEEDHLPLPGASVYLKGSSVGTSADVNGRFEFPQKLKEGDVLVVNYIGLDAQEYTVPKKAPEAIEITMVLSCSYLEMMGEVAVDGIYEPNNTRFHELWWKFKGLF